MNFNNFKEKGKVYVSSLGLAVVLFLVISTGISSGQKQAQAQTLVQASAQVEAGLRYFYSDQDRFPSALEFSDQNVMLNYFTSFPPSNFPSSLCAQSFIYKKAADDNFQLSFCLPVKNSQFNKGWNTINGGPAS